MVIQPSVRLLQIAANFAIKLQVLLSLNVGEEPWNRTTTVGTHLGLFSHARIHNRPLQQPFTSKCSYTQFTGD